jgi:ketosteroid isomerase-like protein
MRSLVLLALIGCSAPAAPPPAKPAPPPNELTPALEPLRPMLGDWQFDEGSFHAVAAAGTIYIGAFHRETVDALIFDNDGLTSVSADTDPITFQRAADSPLAFTGPNGIKVVFAFAGDTFTATIAEHVNTFHRATAAAAPELEAADVAFAKDVDARGVAGWTDAFDPRGVMVRRDQRLIGHDAIAEAITPVLSDGKLAWAPIASRRQGDVGFTVGKATHTGKDAWKSTYLTLWRKQPDGSWKVLLDTGRPAQ